jgi:toxin ParE1/3/4
MAKIVWAPSALKDIDSIANYIAADSVAAAKNMVALFFESAQILEQFPQIGKPVKETKDVRLRELLIGRYRIIYEVNTEDGVNILSVHHQSRLLKNNPTFKKRLRK